MNYNKLRDIAEQARNNKDWKNALRYYRQIYEMKTKNIWDKYFYALSLVRNDLVEETIRVCQEIYAESPSFVPNNRLYAMSIAKKYLDHIDYDNKEELLQDLNTVKEVSPKDDDYWSMEKIFYKIFKKIEMDREYEVLDWLLDNFEPDDADYDALVMYDYNNNFFPPFVETYYVFRVKVEYALKNYEQAIEKATEALDIIKKFFYQNNLWMRRIRALSYWHIGENNLSLKDYFYLLRYKRDWFIYFEIAQILQSAGYKEAVDYFVAKAILDNQKLIYKIKLFQFLADNETSIVPPIVAQLIVKLLKDDNIIEVDRENKTNTVFRKVQQQANSFLYSEKHKGKVFMMFNKMSGLLRIDNKTLYFFTEKRIDNLQKGVLVEYVNAWNFDAKKNKMKKCALVLRSL